MADTTVIVFGPTGLTSHKLELYAAGSDAIANTSGGDALSEATNRHGRYEATVTEALAGTYTAIVADSGGNGVAIFEVTLADDVGPYTCQEPVSVPTAAGIADAVFDEALSGHTTAGTAGKAFSDILGDTDELQTNQGNWLTATGFSTHSASDVASAVWAYIGETSLSMLKIMRRILATTAGEEAADSTSTTRKYMSPNESVTRVTAEISGGRRSSVTYNDLDES